MRLCFRATRFNRFSLPAVAGVIEHAMGAGAIEMRVLSSLGELAATDLVAYSFGTCEAESVALEVGRLRERLGDRLKLLAGGPHPSACPGETRAMGFRWVIAGEAGDGLARLLGALSAGDEPADGVVREAPCADLDPCPPWPGSLRMFSPIELTRGCPNACAFCQTPRLHGGRVRHRSAASLLPHLRRAVQAGRRQARFVSPNAFAYGSADGRTPDPRKLDELFAVVRKSGMTSVYLGTFPSEVRPESVTREVLCMVRDACTNRTISIGLQSGSDRMLRALNRGHTVQQCVSAIAAIARAGFRPSVDLIFGLPGEDDEDRADTREVMRQVVDAYGAQIHAHVFVPLAGTPLAGQAAQRIDPATRALVEQLTGRGKIAGVRRRAPWTRP